MELSRKIPKRRYFKSTIVYFLTCCMFFNTSLSVALAGPEGAQVVNGQVSFQQSSYNTTITASDKSIINYSSFDIARPEIVQFIQPGSSASVLNRILSANPTNINGTLLANGRVFFVNPAGVYIGAGARINVNQLVASGLNITNSDFINGQYNFAGGEGAVINSGDISAEKVYLIGRQVANFGSISCPAGYVVMASGDRVFLGEPGTDVVLEVDAPSLPESAETIEGSGVLNEGTIDAAGGTIVLAAGDIYSQAISNTGSLSASFEAGEAGQVKLIADGGQIVNSGNIEASGDAGGEVIIDGGDVTLSSDSTIHTDGMTANAGNISIHGTYTVEVGPEALLTADARGDAGDGGSVIVLGDEIAVFEGTISAQGGQSEGAGGFAEVSGKHVKVGGHAVLTAAGGQTGEFLIDPGSVDIVDGGDVAPDTDTFNDGWIENQLTTSALTIDTTASDNDEAEVIDFANDASVGWATGNEFQLKAGERIDFRGTVSSTGGGNFVMDSPTVDLYSSNITVSGGGELSGTAATVNVKSDAVSIGTGIAVADDTGATINVAAGTYTENLIVDKPDITLKSKLGEDVTLNANSGNVVDLVSGADGFTLGGADGEGFTINSGGGATRLFQITHGSSGVEVSWNEFDTTGSAQHGISIGAAGATDLKIYENDFISEGGDLSIWGPEMVGLTVLDNDFTVPGGPPASGWAIQFAGVTPGGLTGSSTITGNTISGYAGGISVFNGEATSDLTISENDISDGKTGIRLGQYVQSGHTAGDMTTVTVTANTLTNNTTGLLINDGANVIADEFLITNNFFVDNDTGIVSQHTSESATIYENSFVGDPTDTGVSNTSNLVLLNASGNWWGTNDAAGVAAEVSADVDYTPWLDDGTDQSGDPGFQGAFSHLHVDVDSPQTGGTGWIQEAIDLVTASTVEVEAGTYTENLIVDKPDITLKSKLGEDVTLNANSGNVVDLVSGADGFTLGGADGEGFTINSGGGATRLFQITHGSSGVEVSWNEFDTTGSAQHGISIGAAGATDLKIYENDFISEGGDLSIWGPEMVGLTVLDNDFTVPGGPPASGWAIQFAGVTPGGLTGSSTITGNTISGYAGGISVFNGEATSDLTISENDISDGKTGIRLGQYVQSGHTAGDMTTVTVTANTLTNNTTGLLINDGANVIADEFLITNNFFVDNDTGIVSQHTSESATIYENSFVGDPTDTGVSNTSNLVLLNASGNWWGTNDAAGVAAEVSADVDYTPWLDDGTDTDLVTPGFQGDFSTLHVSAASPQVGSTGRINEAIGLLNPNGTINVLSGDYTPEDVAVNKDLTLTVPSGTATMNSLTSDASKTADLWGNFTANGTIDTVFWFKGAVTLAGDVTLTSSNNKAITFNSTVDGSQALVLNTDGVTTFNDTVGSSGTELASLTTDAGGRTEIGAGTINLNGTSATFNDAVLLTANLTINEAGSGNINFASTVDSQAGNNYTLAVNSGAGATIFGDAVGSGSLTGSEPTGLGTVTTNAAGTTELSDNVTTSGAQTYNDDVDLMGAVIATSNNNQDITFAKTVDGAQTLEVKTGGATKFQDIVGGVGGALTSLITDDPGTTELSNNVTTSGAQTYNDDVDLMGAVIATSNNNQDITFAKTVDGAQTLEVKTGGATKFQDIVGGVGGALTSLITDDPGTTELSNNVTTSGAQTYNDDVDLMGAVIATSNNNQDITFAKTVDGAQTLEVKTGGATKFQDIVGGVGGALTSLITDDPGTTELSNNVTTSGAQTYNDDVDLMGAVIATSNNNQDITFAKTVDGAQTLEVKTGGATKFQDIVGGVGGALTSLITDDPGTTELSNNVTTSGAQTYNDDVDLMGAVIATSNNNQDITFAKTVDGAQTLEVKTGGATKFQGIVGGVGGALTSLITDDPGTTELSNNVTTSGAQTYNDDVDLMGAVIATSNNNQDIIFAKTVDGAQTLEVKTGGATKFQGIVGGVGGALTSLITDDPGTTELSNNVTTSGAQTYNDDVDLMGAVIATSNNNQDITFAKTVDGAQTLEVRTGGATKFQGIVGGVGGALTSLTTDASGTTSLGGDVTTTGDQTYNDDVTVSDGTTLKAGNDVKMGAGKTLTGEGDLILEATNGGITEIGGDNKVQIKMAADDKTLTLNQNDLIDMTNFYVTNKSDVTDLSATDLIANSTGGSVSALSGDDNPADLWKSITATADSGITLTGIGSITANTLTSTNGNIGIKSGAAVALNGTVTTQNGGGVTVTAQGDVTTQQPITTEALSVTTNSNIEIHSNSGDLNINDNLTAKGGGVKLIADGGKIYTSGDTLDVAITGYSDDTGANNTGVYLPAGTGKAAIVILSKLKDLNLGTNATLTANGWYDDSLVTGVDDRASVNFLPPPETEVTGERIDVAIYLGSFNHKLDPSDAGGNVTVNSTVSMPDYGTMVIDAHDTVEPFISNFTDSDPWNDITNSLEVVSRISQTLDDAADNKRLPHADEARSDIVPSWFGGEKYVLRGKDAVLAEVLGKIEPVPLVLPKPLAPEDQGQVQIERRDAELLGLGDKPELARAYPPSLNTDLNLDKAAQILYVLMPILRDSSRIATLDRIVVEIWQDVDQPIAPEQEAMIAQRMSGTPAEEWVAALTEYVNVMSTMVGRPKTESVLWVMQTYVIPQAEEGLLQDQTVAFLEAQID